MATSVFTDANSLDPSLQSWEGHCPIYSHFTGDKTKTLEIFYLFGDKKKGGRRAVAQCGMSVKNLTQHSFQEKMPFILPFHK